MCNNSCVRFELATAFVDVSFCFFGLDQSISKSKDHGVDKYRDTVFTTSSSSSGSIRVSTVRF